MENAGNISAVTNTTSVRRLVKGESKLLVEGGIEFFGEGKIPGTFNAEFFCQRIESLMDAGNAVFGIFGPDGKIHGAIAGILYNDTFTGDLMAVELFWFMRSQYRKGTEGLKLLDAYENWARASGAKRIAMIHLLELQPEILKRVYERRGYRAVETNYLKEVK